jgi:Reverse transcriptase (RNA-dependent DNA polymerase)
VWQAAKYLSLGKSGAFDKVPPLRKADEETTSSKEEQATALLHAFFPPLPQTIEPEGEKPQRAQLDFPRLTLEEVEEAVFKAHPWKAPGHDGIPAGVWRHIWPVVKGRVWRLFQCSLDEGRLPHQWKTAKVIPLKKPGKGDYTLAKSWRPISLLPTLGKALEAVIAERISQMAEEHGLLPTNQFGARKRRSAEQALILLQENIFKAWRSRKVLSLVSFDVKGAYNGVYKERLIQRLQARGIPAVLLRWIDSFCSERTATIQVNGFSSGEQSLPQAGLPQGSPLSPILFLFFNADLVQHKIDTKGGAIAFVDDYTAWVTGPSGTANRPILQDIVNRANHWGSRSGASFEPQKTAYVHFTRTDGRSDDEPLIVKGERAPPQQEVKILGVIMDSKLRYRAHMARTHTKGLQAAMALKRLRMISPATARRLFTATVIPVVDYACNVWSSVVTPGSIAEAGLNRIQRIGAQAVTGVFRTVATAVAEAEAHLCPVMERHAVAATRMLCDLPTLPKTNPLTRLETKAFSRFVSPLQKWNRQVGVDLDRNHETIQPYIIAPWESRIKVAYNEEDISTVLRHTTAAGGVLIAVGVKCGKTQVGIGACIHDTLQARHVNEAMVFQASIGTQQNQSPSTAEMAAIVFALDSLPLFTGSRQITIVMGNRSAALAIEKPRQQSGQYHLREIYEKVGFLQFMGNRVQLCWVPNRQNIPIQKRALRQATLAAETGPPQGNSPVQMKAPLVRTKVRKIRANRVLPKDSGRFSRNLDSALPGNHVRSLYDSLRKPEAAVLAQLRTGHCRLDAYLHRIHAAESDQCRCGKSRETVQHFLFQCEQWTEHREEMKGQATTRWGDLSFFLGGRSTHRVRNRPLDPDPWKPSLPAVRATIRFVMTTGRFQSEPADNSLTQQSASGAPPAIGLS